MSRTQKSNPQPERDIFHSEPAPGAVERDLTKCEFFMTFKTIDDLFYNSRDRHKKNQWVKLNRPTESGRTHTTFALELPICKGKQE